jgi:hypothetical protein
MPTILHSAAATRSAPWSTDIAGTVQDSQFYPRAWQAAKPTWSLCASSQNSRAINLETTEGQAQCRHSQSDTF